MGSWVRTPCRRVTFLFFLWITMFRYRSRRIDRVVQDFANFEVCFVLGKELLPVFDTLRVCNSLVL